MFGALARRLFGSANDRYVKSLGPLVDRDQRAGAASSRRCRTRQLRARTAEFKQRLADGAELDDLLVEAFATVREAAEAHARPAPFRRAADGRRSCCIAA